MKIKDKEYRVRELVWEKDSGVYPDRLYPDFEEIAKTPFGKFTILPYPERVYSIFLDGEVFACRRTLPEAKAFCQKHLEEQVMSLVEEVE